MLFLVDNNRKVIIGWSAKCGCSHIKTIFWYLVNNDTNPKIHTEKDKSKLPRDIHNYITIIISRNPYKRIVSGFLDKYKPRGEFRNLWKHKKITFSMFVDELVKNDWRMIEKHHFTNQTSENFHIKILKSKTIKFYDIENIDYSYIESLYDKEIPSSILSKKQGHERGNYNINIEKHIYNDDMTEYLNSNVETRFFYNKDLKDKVYEFYKNDFIFFNDNGINYIDTIMD